MMWSGPDFCHPVLAFLCVGHLPGSTGQQGGHQPSPFRVQARWQREGFSLQSSSRTVSAPRGICLCRCGPGCDALAGAGGGACRQQRGGADLGCLPGGKATGCCGVETRASLSAWSAVLRPHSGLPRFEEPADFGRGGISGAERKDDSAPACRSSPFLSKARRGNPAGLRLDVKLGNADE